MGQTPRSARVPPDPPSEPTADAEAPATARLLILSVHVTHEHGSLALTRGATLVEEVSLHAPSGFAQILYPELERLLARHAVTLAEIACFAAASGPGSFTGVRVGLACVKGLAEALGKPAVAVSNLESLATFGHAPLRAPVIDARRGDIYGAVYDANGAAIAPEVVTKLEPWLLTIPPGAEFVTMEGESLALPETARITVAPRSQAAAIARIALSRLQSGAACDPAALDANYVRRPDAELFWTQ